MPRLVKGGKFIFGWSLVKETGQIKIPPEAFDEYRFRTGEKIIVLSGSKTSKGFGITTPGILKSGPIYRGIRNLPELITFQKLEGGYLKRHNRVYTWSEIDGGGYFHLGPEILFQYSVCCGDRLLVCRGSRFALGFIIEGPIVGEARNHSELQVFD